MAERFTGYGMPSLDFSKVSQLGDIYDKGRQGAVHERMLSEIGQGKLDPAVASQKAFAAGDVDTGISLARLAESRGDRSESRALRQQQFEFQKQEAERNERFRRDQFDFQKSQAAEKPAITWQGAEGEEKTPYLVDPKNPDNIRRLQPAGGAPASTATNPYAPPGKSPTEAQSKDAGYADRILDAEKTLQNPDAVKAAQSYMLQGVSKVPGVGLGIAGSSYRQFDQASRNFINAVLRRESGAVINPDEFTNARIQYLPGPNDDEASLKQKAANRRAALEGIASGGGKGYQPRMGFDADGKIVPIEGAKRRGELPSQSAPQFKSPDEVTRMIQTGKLKSGDTFRDPDGILRRVP